MDRSFLRSLALLLPLLLLSGPGHGAPAGVAGSHVLRLTAGAPVLEPVADGDLVVPRIAGFGHNSRPGEPMLPLKIVLVAIPEGTDPVLRVRSADERLLRIAAIAPVPRTGQSAGQTGRPGAARPMEDFRPADVAREFAPDPRLYEGDGFFPGEPVRLGRVGYLREQRFVEVLFTPVLYAPRAGMSRLFSRVDAEVEFRRRDGAGVACSAPAIDPAFEETYRASLANYDQGRAFRVRPGERLEEPALEDGGDDDDPMATSSRATSAGTPPPTTSTTSVFSPTTSTTTSATTSAEAPRYKLSVSRPGVYRLDHAWLQANAPEMVTADPRTLILEAEGVPVPIAILSSVGGSGEADGSFDPGDALEFHGRPRTEPPTLLNHDFGSTFPDIYQANDFTDTQVYWLSATAAAGSAPRIPAVSGTPISGSHPLAATFLERGLWEENNLYLPLGDAEPFFSMPALVAGGSLAQRDLAVPLPGLAAVTAEARVRVRLRGSFGTSADPDHHTRVWINNDTGGGIDFTWDGDVIVERDFAVSQSLLTNPTTAHVRLPGLDGVSTDVQYLDLIGIDYQRTFAAAGDALVFPYPNQDARFQVSGFSGGPPTIYEITRAVAGSGEADPVRILDATVSGAGSATYTFQVDRDGSAGAPATRTFAVLGPLAIRLPDAVARAADPVLADPANEADFLVIAARGTVDPAPGGALDDLLAHRLRTQGFTSKIVYVDQIYDEFSHGLRDPNAIRAFLNHAFENWRGAAGTARPPSYVLLAGDATPDYKNVLGRSDWVDQVPAAMMFHRNAVLGYYSSDNWLASFRGDDQIPDVHLGRISTRTAAEAAAVFDKIRRFEESPPSGLWKGHMALLAGDGKTPEEAQSFEQLQSGIAGAFFSQAPYSVPDPPLYFARPPWNSTDAAGYRDAIIAALDAGTALLSFVGHGGFDTWGLTTFMTTGDAAGLANGSLLPFMVNINCLAGGFHYFLPGGSLGEGMTNNPAGGAVATLAPSGLSNIFIGDPVASDLFGPLFDRRRETILGAATTTLRTALWSRGFVIDLQSYTFLGDPATRIATPAPAPPSGLTAVAGNGEVTLSWTASLEPAAGYSIYRRATTPTGTYVRVECTPLTATSCVDATVVNATTYYYYAVSRDGEGFEGGASNFNSDCDSGPDCVTARPINPDPPSAPAQPALRDAGTGGVLEVSWSPNPEKDVKTYSVHYGTSPGAYTGRVTVNAPSTSTNLSGLTDGLRYYVALTATNTSGLESAPSPESSEVPHLFLGIAPPRAITDLMVVRSGPDLGLTWSRPLVDIYGRPTTVVGYRLYRGTTPGFLPFSSPPYATIDDSTRTSFTDAGAASSTSAFYYLVTALDASGLESGAGRDLPNGTMSLSVVLIDPSTARLSWSPVLTDVRGLPTVISHYQVHRMNRPVSRGSLGSATLFMDNVTSTSVDLPVLSGATYFTVLAVDNRGNVSPF